MNYVEPIRDGEKVRDIENYLKKTNIRNYLMFITGIYTGLRVSDILKLRVRDVKNKDHIALREKKTKHQRFIPINSKLKKEFKKYCEGKEPDEFLIKSQKGYNDSIQRDMAYKILRETGELFGIYNLGTHSMRKTFGYNFYKTTGDIVSLQKYFKHSSQSVTLRYIGIEQEEMNKVIKGLKYY